MDCPALSLVFTRTMLSQLVESSVTVHDLDYLTVLSNCIIAQTVVCFLLQRPDFNTKVVEKAVLEKTVS